VLAEIELLNQGLIPGEVGDRGENGALGQKNVQ
jgi:hypothetical protein